MLKTAVTIMLLIANSLLVANTLYVGDTLRVGIRSEPSRAVAPHTVITTGAMVEQLDKVEGYYLIRTAEGVEGWVRSIYMMDQQPAQFLLDDLQEKNNGLKAEISQMQREAAATKAAINSVQQLQSENNQLKREIALQGEDKTWLIWFSGILAIGPLGFLFGLLWYRYQIMKKLGGLTL